MVSCDVYRRYRKNSVVMNIVKEAKCQIMVYKQCIIFFRSSFKYCSCVM